MLGLIFTYLMAYGGAVVAVFFPYIGLLIYVCFAIIKPEAMWFWAVTPGNYSRIIAIALLLGWVLQGFGRWEFHRGTAVVYSLAGLLLWAAFGAIFAENQQVAWVWV